MQVISDCKSSCFNPIIETGYYSHGHPSLLNSRNHRKNKNNSRFQLLYNKSTSYKVDTKKHERDPIQKEKNTNPDKIICTASIHCRDPLYHLYLPAPGEF